MREALARWWTRTRARFTGASGAEQRGAGRDGAAEEVDLVDQARREWLAARTLFDNVSEPDLVDHAIHRMTAAERRYMFLIKEARRSGVLEHDLRQLVAEPPAAGAPADPGRPA